VISDPHYESDHHQNLLTSRGSPLIMPYQVWSTFHQRFRELSCGQTDTQTQ